MAIQYVDHDNAEIRKAAALTCCQLFVRDPIVHQTSSHAIRVVSEVIEKLLTVGVADAGEHISQSFFYTLLNNTDSEIRRTVLLSLDARFDRHLAKPENVRTLFLALNDEVFPVREAAMSIIGRLTLVNPAYVMPSLRKTLVQLLTELEYSNVSRNKEESARLLSLLVAASQKLIKPYVDPMVTVLLPKARDPNSGVASTILRAIGELATVGGEDMLPYIHQLMPIIIDALQDLSSQAKREAALRTLGQLASNSGYVIDPYIEYPQLLTILISIVKTEQTGSLRKETIKLMGILGALDPYKHQVGASSEGEYLAGRLLKWTYLVASFGEIPRKSSCCRGRQSYRRVTYNEWIDAFARRLLSSSGCKCTNGRDQRPVACYISFRSHRRCDEHFQNVRAQVRTVSSGHYSSILDSHPAFATGKTRIVL